MALDGDADSPHHGPTATGTLYDGDQLLYVIATDYMRRKALTGGVVGTR
jgi:phosphomannomutase